jgi:hypothetical protein
METILEILGESSVRAIVIAFATAFVLWVLQVKSPGICHRAWTGVLMTMLCLPFFSMWAPRIAIPVLPASSIPAVAKRPALGDLQVPAPGIAAARSAVLNPSTQRPQARPAAFRMNIYQAAGILYLAGFCVFTFRLLAGTLLSLRLGRGASRDGRVFYSPQCTIPITVGVWRARIFLPAESKNWDQGKLDAVLTHEQEHMRRRDPLVVWIALLNRGMYWFNPLAWWLCARLSALAEQACDEAVIARGHDSGVYAGHLLEFARSVKSSGALTTVWGSSLHGSTLARRIRRILSSGITPAISPVRMTLVAVLWIAAAVAAISFELLPVHAAPPLASAVAFPSSGVEVPEVTAPQSMPTPPAASSLPSRSIVPPDNTLYETGTEYLKQRQYIKARLAYQTLLSTYPNSRLAAPAFLAIADSFNEEGGAENLTEAVEKYKDFVVFFPLDPKAADAGMKIISINMKALQSENATGHSRSMLLRTQLATERFLSSFPDSGYRRDAEKILEDINRELANQRLSDITGYVVNQAGKPIRGVSISAFERVVTGLPPAPVASASSDEQGYFALRGIPLENKIEVHFEGESLATLVYDDPDLFNGPLRITMHELWIERIDIKGNRRIPEDTIRFYIQSKPGDLYSPAKLAYDVQALYKSNFYENVEVQERDGESGEIITFIVDEKLLIRSIHFIGNRSITEPEILEAFAVNKVGLALDSQFEYRKAMTAERILKKLLAERGKPNASVRIETETLPPSSIRLRFIIDEDGNLPTELIGGNHSKSIGK